MNEGGTGRGPHGEGLMGRCGKRKKWVSVGEGEVQMARSNLVRGRDKQGA